MKGLRKYVEQKNKPQQVKTKPEAATRKEGGLAKYVEDITNTKT